MTEVELFRVEVPGEPVPWPRARINPKTGKLYLPRNYLAYRDLLAMMLGVAARKQSDLREPTDDPVVVIVGVYRKSKRRADVDNLAKTVLDAGIGVVWTDDVQVERLHVEKRQVERDPRVEVIAYRRVPEGATLH